MTALAALARASASSTSCRSSTASPTRGRTTAGGIGPVFSRACSTVIAEQLAIVDADVDQLYDDLFIETCDPWVVPYIGDLVGVTPGAPMSPAWF